MSVIGTFEKNANGFLGTVRTATLDLEVRIEPEAEKLNDRAPDYRVWTGSAEFGVGWIREHQRLGRYPSLKLDDPAFPAPVYANLVPDEANPERFLLLWSR